jgi:hypothetical protein
VNLSGRGDKDLENIFDYIKNNMDWQKYKIFIEYNQYMYIINFK